jgi:hypothetical protein
MKTFTIASSTFLSSPTYNYYHNYKKLSSEKGWKVYFKEGLETENNYVSEKTFINPVVNNPKPKST